jgi:pilus assembly protein FimV
MTTINRISAAAILVAVSLTFSPIAWSLGLGEATVESYLNQPLQVRIDLISRESDDLASVTAKLASADDYELIGANREMVPVPIGFTVEDIEGDAHIVASSNLPIGDPVVRLIVEVNWSSGRLLREYMIFLDPPAFSEQAPPPRIDERKAPPVVSEPAREPSETLAEEPPPAPAQPPSPAASGQTPAPGEYGPVKSGETLWKIASNWSRGSGMNINKVMIAIQRENPSAFMNNNINLLKRGAILRMPEAADVDTISTAVANTEVTSQTDEFEGRKSTAAAEMASPSTPLLAEESVAFSPSDSETPSMEVDAPDEALEAETPDLSSASAEQPLEPTDQLELVPPSAESDLDSTYGLEESDEGTAEIADSTSALRENLARSEEELINQQQQNAYLEERIKELETELESAKAGRIEDAELANMEERLRAERQAQAAESQPTAEAARSRTEGKPWYSRLSLWLVGLLVLAAVFIGWLISRRGGGDESDSGMESGQEQLREIKDEAEEVLRVLDEPDPVTKPEDEESTEEPAEVDEPQAKPVDSSEDDAELLDEESSDPEIQLDLARAYISMGDKEAARVILEEVVANGSEEQQAEATKMLELLAS